MEKKLCDTFSTRQRHDLKTRHRELTATYWCCYNCFSYFISSDMLNCKLGEPWSHLELHHILAGSLGLSCIRHLLCINWYCLYHFRKKSPDVSKCNCAIECSVTKSFKQDRTCPASVWKYYVIKNGSSYRPPHVTSAASERPANQPACYTGIRQTRWLFLSKRKHTHLDRLQVMSSQNQFM